MTTLKLPDIIDELGRLTADQIAERFEQLGIKGTPLDACFCPIANYIFAIFPGNVSVSPHRIVVWDNSNRYSVALSEDTTIEQFIIKFDNGVYDNLIDGNRTHEYTLP